jgi:hypothetical protein
VVMMSFPRGAPHRFHPGQYQRPPPPHPSGGQS